MKFTSILSVLLLGAMLTVCFAAEPVCFDMKAFAAHGAKCKAEVDAAAAADKVTAGLVCCLRAIGAIDGDKVIYEKLREGAAASALPGKAAIVTAGYDACKDKFTTADKVLDGKKCVYEQLKDQCPEMEVIKKAMGF